MYSRKNEFVAALRDLTRYILGIRSTLYHSALAVKASLFFADPCMLSVLSLTVVSNREIFEN
jgi:hypothetical protein